MSHNQRVDSTYTDGNGQAAAGYILQQVFDKPTVTVTRVGTGPVYVGDKFVVRVAGTIDSDAGPSVAAVPGAVDNHDGTFTVTAV